MNKLRNVSNVNNFTVKTNSQVKEEGEIDRYYYIKELILELQELCTLLRKQEESNPFLGDYKGIDTIEETVLAVEYDDSIYASNAKVPRKEVAINTETKYTEGTHKIDNVQSLPVRESSYVNKNDYIPSMECDTIKNLTNMKTNVKRNKYKCLEYLESKLRELTLLRHNIDLNIETQNSLNEMQSSGDIRENWCRKDQESDFLIKDDKSQVTDKLPRQLQEILTLKEQVHKLKKENIMQKKKIMKLQQSIVVDADRENDGTGNKGKGEFDGEFLMEGADRLRNENLKASCLDVTTAELQNDNCSFSNKIWNVDDYDSDNFCSISISKEYAQIGNEIQCRPVVIIKPSLINRKVTSFVEVLNKDSTGLKTKYDNDFETKSNESIHLSKIIASHYVQ